MSEVKPRLQDRSPETLATAIGDRSPEASDPEATLDSSAAAVLAAADGAKEPQTIGPYRLVRKLGEGGMGQVWLAEQTAPIQRQVALKLIRVGRYDDSVLQRFYAERQSLAIMDHPSIAKVFDAGATPDGQPYFVMEYVPGQPITDYCDRKRLKIRERLELFIQVCEGVQHAHQKAVMHRDLKPANILVVEVDGKPVPRIIDFGLAKTATPQLDGETLFTQAGGWVGTPGYMSPEQADPGVMDVDTRTDVYSLGAVLYVLLTGFLPLESKDWRKQRLDEFLRRLREEDPPRPSTKVSADKESSQAAEARGTEPGQLVSLLHGDLDWITMKALDKDRVRRYGTPMELAADIGRYLANEPIVARPSSTSYRLKKYVRRHRVSAAVVAGLVLLLAAFAVMQGIQIRRVTQERDRATRITDFMLHVFKVSDPSESRGNSVTARELLDKASKDIDTGLANDPGVQAQMAQTIGNVYESLGLYPRAEALDRKALSTRTQTLGIDGPDTIESMSRLAGVLDLETKFPESEKLARDSLNLARKKFGPSATITLDSATQLGGVLTQEGHYPEAEAVLRQALVDVSKKKGAQDEITADLETHLATVYAYQGKSGDSEKAFRHVYEIRKTLYGADDPRTLNTQRSIGNTLLRQHKFSEAESTYRQVIERQSRVLGPEHPDTLTTTGNLGLVLILQTRYAEAEPLLRQVVEGKLRVLGPDNRSTLVVQGQLADVIYLQGRMPEAEKLVRQTLDTEARVMGPAHSDTLSTMALLAAILVREHEYSQAESTYRQLLELRTKALGPDHLGTLDAAADLALLRVKEHHYSEGETVLREQLAKRIKLFTPHSSSNATVEFNLACALALEGKRDEAFSHLQTFLDDGPQPETVKEMISDPSLNLASLHNDPRFDTLIAKGKAYLAAPPNNK